MSLVVSLRIPDGMVIAADSLSTAKNIVGIEIGSIDVKCPNCSQAFDRKSLALPAMNLEVPFSGSSYTQKLINLNGKFALSFFGNGVIGNKSIYYHVKQQLKAGVFDNKTLNEVNQILVDYFEKALLLDFPNYIKEAPSKWHPIGYHLNGYENIDGADRAITYEVHVGKNSDVKQIESIGCTIGGDMTVVQKLWELGRPDKGQAVHQIKYGLLSLQDAIDLSIFFIETTSKFQRFADQVQTVGGDIDVALITPFHDFQWIRRKRLMEVIENGKK